MRLLILLIAVGYAVNGSFMLIAPQSWYDTVPGMHFFGPYNTHFIRDVSIVYLVSAGGFAWGLRAQRAGYLLMASAWPALHAIYHLQVWAARGFPVDIILAVNAPFDALKFSNDTSLTWYRASNYARRGFCNKCGSSLFWHGDKLDGHKDRIAIALGALDAPTGLALTEHIFVADKGDYYEIADGLPQKEKY